MRISRHAGGRTATALLLALTTLAGLLTARPAQAQLTLTPAGTTLGFGLTNFATGFPTDGSIGPLGIAFTSGGSVLVSDYPGNVRLFPTDTDGQNAASVPVAQNYGDHNAVGLATVGSSIYMTRQGIGGVVQINPNGTFNQVIDGSIGNATGIVSDPANGHLFVSDVSGHIYDVDPIAKTKTLFTGANVDGLSLSPDGKTLYGANNSTGHLLGFSILSGSQTFDSGFIAGGIDGTASGYGILTGNIFANTNGGTVVEINLTTMAQTQIATGGSRGDFLTVDPSNSTLLLTQSDRIIRLTGGTFVPVPEASSVISFGLMLLGGGVFLASRKRKSRSA